jgi:hypothetical protein
MKLNQDRLNLNNALKTEDIEAAAEFFTHTIQLLVWNATSEYKRKLRAVL